MKEMTFKSIIADDCKNVFLNENEFAEIHKINGKPMRAIIDKNELIDRQKGNPHNDGTYEKSILIYVLASECGAKPKIGSRLTLDGKHNLLVKDVTDECGIYSITGEEVRMV